MDSSADACDFFGNRCNIQREYPSSTSSMLGVELLRSLPVCGMSTCSQLNLKGRGSLWARQEVCGLIRGDSLHQPGCVGEIAQHECTHALNGLFDVTVRDTRFGRTLVVCRGVQNRH